MRFTKAFYSLLTIFSFLLFFSISAYAQPENQFLKNNKINTCPTLKASKYNCSPETTIKNTSKTTSNQKRAVSANRKSYKSRVARKRKTVTVEPVIAAEK